MKKSILSVVFAILCVLLVVSHYDTLVDVFYRIKEPYFLCPVVLPKDHIIPIRSDSWGGGLFGAKRSGKRRHKGIDITTQKGAYVFASKSGLAYTNWHKNGWGKYVTIEHPDGTKTLYAHLDKILIDNKRWVNQGKLIGLVGKTGNANIAGMVTHLHFEIIENNKSIDPLTKYLLPIEIKK